MTDRAEQLMQFLTHAGWGRAARIPLAGDASTRRYERLSGARGTAVLMDAPPQAETPTCPPGANENTRRALGYNALAALAGPDLTPFVAIACWLADAGFSAPRILAADMVQGFLLLEDLGDDLFTIHLQHHKAETVLYQEAIDALLALHGKALPTALPVRHGAPYTLKAYDTVALLAEARLLLEWYAPLVTGKTLPGGALESFEALWRSLAHHMLPEKSVVVLRDYHAENLFWLPGRAGVARVGLLDFQDGVLGHPAYDLVSLLEDARRDVPVPLADAMLRRYSAGARGPAGYDFDAPAFHCAYAAWGAQRNSKILGIFARLALRDHKPQYLDFTPRVWRYLERDLAHPALSGLRSWYDTHIPPAVRHQIPKPTGRHP